MLCTMSRKGAKMLQLLDSTSLFLLLFTAWSGLFFNLSPYCGEGEAFCALTFKVICSILMKGKTAKGGKISTNINVF